MVKASFCILQLAKDKPYLTGMKVIGRKKIQILVNKSPENTYAYKQTGIWITRRRKVIAGKTKTILGTHGVQVLCPDISLKASDAKM